MSGASSSGSGAAASQTATAATAATAQAAQAAITARRAQDSFIKAASAFQAMQASQAAANAAAAALTGANHLTGTTDVPDGLGIGGLNPVGGATVTTAGTTPTTQAYNVPNAPGYAWTGVGALSQSTGNGQTTVTITQTASEALLYWTSFNIGKKTLLNFDQSAGGPDVGTWVAINQIVNDPSLAPSQILGSIQAPGQVYVINQNGIIFGGSSQVNTHALVASSLPINTNLLTPELLLGGATAEDQFLFSQLPVDTITGTTNALPTFTPPAAPAGGDGDVVVEPGAQLSSPTTPEHVGGRIALLGPVVDNEGTISTPDGQTILAAGLQVGFNAHSQNDPSLRGLDVFVGAVTDPSTGASSDANGTAYGTVTNGGLINSPRADITLAGMNLNQNGQILSQTSVSLNGRIDLLADYGATVFAAADNGVNVASYLPSSTGTVTLGPNSLTEILPDTTGDTITGIALALPSLVNIQGINLSMLPGAQLLAPGAQANGAEVDLAGEPITSGVNFTAGLWQINGSTSNLSPTDGQVTIGSGAVIDVSGSQNVTASVTENIIPVQLRGTELADDPLQQTGPLRGQTVDVDISQSGVYDGQAWIGSPIGDLSGYAALVQHTVNELTVNGGSVGIEAGNSVNLAAGSTINVSGGWINYQGADVQTTKVVTAQGQILDIAQATPDQIYQGIYSPFTQSSAKWGVSQTFNNGLVNATSYDPGYLQGGNGGALTISTPSLSLQGNLYGNTVAGQNQMAVSKSIVIQSNGTQLQTTGLASFANANFSGSNFLPIVVPMKAAPSPSTLELNLFAQPAGLTPVVQPEDIVFQPSQGPKVVDPYAATGNPELDLSADLINVDGFGRLFISGDSASNSDFNATNAAAGISTQGDIVLPASVALTTQPGGEVVLYGVNLDIEGSIFAPGGTLSMTAQNIEAQVTAGSFFTPAAPDRGNFTLGANASLSTAGLIVNNEASSATANTQTQVVNGGTITIKAYNADLEAGSSIDASGGVVINSAGKATFGTGGKIDIEAGLDPFNAASLNYGIIGGTLNLGANLSAFSGTTGGALTIVAPAIQIGGDALQNGDTSGTPVQENGLVWGNGTTLWLDRSGSGDFFSEGGFSSFSLTGLGLAPMQSVGGVATVETYSSTPGIFIASGTNLSPIAQNYELTTDVSGATDLSSVTYGLASQRAPLQLSFAATGISPTATLISQPLVRGDLVMEANSTIQTDPSGSVSLTGQSVAVLGKIYAPGGVITVKGSQNSANLFQLANTQDPASNVVATVDLAPGSVLSTAGAAEATFNTFGYNTGTVLNGGSITITGNIVAEAGSVLDVSGTSATFDVMPGAANVSTGAFSTLREVSTPEASNGGSITFNGGQDLFVDATMLGGAGGASAQPGSLSFTNGFSGYNATNPQLSANQSALDATLVVTAGGPVRAAALTGRAVIGQQVSPNNPLTDVDGNAILGYFAASSNLFAAANPTSSAINNGGLAGGFGSLTLNGTVQFSGPVSISTQTSLIVGNNSGATAGSTVLSGGVIYADSPVTLSSAYVRLGLPFLGPNGTTAASPPLSGPGTLTVVASTLIDVGDLSLENGDALNLNSAGDVRGDGTLNVAGNIAIMGAQIYPTTESNFTIAAFDSANGGSTVTLLTSPGSLPPLPLSAGGTLDIYADAIVQGGVLRAPLGTINLGILSPPAGSGLPVTGQITLASGSITSVSAVDPTTGAALTIPYGTIDNNGNWIDPAGNDITAGSTPTLPAKAINLSANNIADMSGSTLDIRGGGDLEAAQFVSGTGGTNNFLASTTSFAVLPAAQQAAYAPFDTDSGYATSSYTNLQVGDQVYLAASQGLPAGVYTLLPAQYALLPGAFLVTSVSGTPSGTPVAEINGSSLVSGYRVSALNGAREQPLATLFEVDSHAVVASRAQYVVTSANLYFPQSAANLAVATPRLPLDAGELVLNSTQSLTLPSTAGTLLAQAGSGGLGSIVDISSPSPINIYNSENTSPIEGDLNLDAAALDSFDADSLFIGGFRTLSSMGIGVTVSTDSITVNNSGAPLIGPDVILVSNDTLTVAASADIESTSASSVTAPTLQFGGDSAVLRVSSDPAAEIVRSGVTPNTDGPDLAVGPQAFIGSKTGGGSVILDSTSATTLDPEAILAAQSVALNSGQVTIVLPNLASPITTPLTGLVLSSSTLSNLQSTVQNFSLLTYSSLDIWGAGNIGDSADAMGQYQVQNLALHTAEIRGFDTGGNVVNINAGNVSLDDSPNGTGLGATPQSPLSGTLAIHAKEITLGINPLAIDQFAQVTLSSSSDIVLSNGTGSLAAAGNLTLSTPLLTVSAFKPLTPLQELNGQPAATATTQTISAAGTLTLANPGGTIPTLTEGLGGKVTLAGTSVLADSTIQLPSGSLTIVATSGDLSVAGNLNVAGTQQNIDALTEYTSGGQISLISYTGNISLGSGGTVNVSAQEGGGNAGSLSISAPEGDFTFTDAAMLGEGGLGGQGGTFSLDADSLAGSGLSPLEAALNPVVSGAVAGDVYLGGFTQAQTVRIRSGDVAVDGTTATDAFNLSTDTGSITVTGEIASNSGQTDANGASTASIDVTTAANPNGQIVLSNPGVTGGTISLEANGSVTLLSGALLSVAAQTVDNAGEGGAVTLAAGNETNGVEPSTSQARDGTTNRFAAGTAVLDIQTGSVIDLSVAATSKMFDGSQIVGTTGTLHLRAPQTSTHTDVQIDPINGAVLNPSSLIVEGYQLFTASDGSIDEQEPAVMTNGNTFVGAAGQPATASYTAMLGALISSSGVNGGLQGLTTIEPGAEIINPTGDLTLASNWDLSTYRFGPNNSAGDLSLRASGNLIIDFGASLSDGFTTDPIFPNLGLWADILMPAGSASWSYQLAAGADFSAADNRAVMPISSANSLVPSNPNALAANSGSLELGLNTPSFPRTPGITTSTIMHTDNFYQTIRTGTGNIDIDVGRDLQLLNNVATIYTAGTQTAALGGFAVPIITDPVVAGNKGYNLPRVLPESAIAQYSQSGGNLTISAQGNIGHYVPWDASSGLPVVAYDSNGNPLMDDSSKELPTNWLLRRGYSLGDAFATNANNQIASTTWWVDFNNFFEGVGALGGGNVTLAAGGDIRNVDAVVPTNARMPGTDANGNLIAPNAANLVETGGGDLTVSAANDISGGVYYVERGDASIDAGDQIDTNATRNVAIGQTASSYTELPTTFYLGKGNIDISTGGDLLLGPIVNPFLLPQGINNTDNDKSYFSTYDAADEVSASSLTGSLTINDAAPTNFENSLLLQFYNDQISAGTPQASFAYYAPWLGLVETRPVDFDTQFRLMPASLQAISFTGDVDLIGNLTLSPSPSGTLNLLAGGSINAYQPVSIDVNGQVSWASSQIDLSDANPASIPGVASPLSYVADSTQNITLAQTNGLVFLDFDNLFNVSGSTVGINAELSTQQALHADLPLDPADPNSALGPLHANDPNPLYLYAATGNIDGLNLFSGKFVDMVAGNDIANVSLYVQNVNSTDITLVEAGQDIVPYDSNSLLRELTHVTGGIYSGENDDASNPSTYFPNGVGVGSPNAGDIQIAGPGTLEVLAGRNLNLGAGPNNGDGTGLGIVSIGNTVDPSLSTFAGANIIAAAGLGGSGNASPNAGLSGFGLDASHNSLLDFAGFENLFLDPSSGGTEAALYLPVIGAQLDLTGDSDAQIWNAFEALPVERQDALATTIFYDVLRDAGRDHNNPNSPNAGTYLEGYLAVSALFPSSNTYQGDITLTAREIKTTNGGDINLLAPGGGVNVGINNNGSQAIDQGILTVDGGNISIFANNDVAVGTSRIFTLHGGNEIIWSTTGNIAAGASSKTVQSAPPTRVLVDPSSGNVQTDLAGLATGGGIGVLETVAGAPPGNVDLIAPSGIVDAGDAGIRSSGNINIAAAIILNAGNIQAGGSTSGVAAASTPNIGATVAASSAAGSSQNAASETARQQQSNPSQPEDLPSIISVQVIGYSSGDSDSADADSPSARELLARNNGR